MFINLIHRRQSDEYRDSAQDHQSANNTNPNFPYLVMNQTNDAKHAFGSGNICDGIHVTINIKTIAPQQIVTSYFPLG